MRFLAQVSPMHLGTPALLDFYRAHCSEDDLVLATIIATVGSTYRKPGAMMLIARDGQFEGLISGGCLEGDLLQHAAEVFASGMAKRVTYDMHADDDLVWSLGLGCDGVIHVLLQRLGRDGSFGFLEQLERAQRLRQAVLLALVTQSDGAMPAGAHGCLDSAGGAEGAPLLLGLLGGVADPWPDWRFKTVRFGDNGAGEAIVVHVPPTPRVLICGAGPDAVPLARLLVDLGWDTVVADHRPAFARADRFPTRCTVLQTRPERLVEVLGPESLDAAVVMTHHLENDSAYLSCLAPYDIPYIGVLGPRARRMRLARLAGISDRAVFGPAGLDIGAELPASIAVAIAAEIHAVLNRRDGKFLTEVEI
jgi:xanthine/CO dehydrogenase XdhC/CoxF family maturation factor